MRLLRVYTTLVKVGWSRALEYRAQVVIWLISFVFPLIMMAVWLAVVDQAGPAAGWTRRDFISYYVAAVVVNQLTSASILWDWDEDLRTGGLSTKLVKPLDPFHYLLSEQMGWTIFFLALLLPTIAVAALLSSDISYPLTPARVLAFLVSVILGFVMNNLIATAFAMLGFWSTQVRNLYSLWWGVGQFVSGWIAPLALFPPGVRAAAQLLPFRGAIGFPIEILMGRQDGLGIAFGLAVSAAWALAALVVYRRLWRAGLKRYDAVGG